MNTHRPILGIPLCCWPYELWRLLVGCTVGLPRVFLARDLIVSPDYWLSARWLIWKARYWPGFLHAWHWDQPCPHGAHKPAIRRPQLDEASYERFWACLADVEKLLADRRFEVRYGPTEGFHLPLDAHPMRDTAPDQAPRPIAPINSTPK